LLAFVALGSAGLEYLHNPDHQREDAREAAQATKGGLPPKPQPMHDESNCAVHAQLHMPFLAMGWVPLLVCLGLLLAFLTLLAPPLVSIRPLLQLDCRGPPAC